MGITAVTVSGYIQEGHVAAEEGCNIETINGAPFSPAPATAAADSAVTLAGWAVDRQSAKVPLNMDMRFTPAGGAPIDIQIRHRIFRPDVAANFGKDTYLIAGFNLTVPPLTLGRGTWRMSIAYSVDGKDFTCDNGRSVVIDEAATP